MALGSTGPPPFGEQLRRLRVGEGLTQEALAQRSRVSVDAISALENGRRRRPRSDTLGMLADALGLDSAERQRLAASARAPGRPRVAGPRHGAPPSSSATRPTSATIRRTAPTWPRPRPP